ncbi:NAD-dependent epimerase/dehydratase family protein [Kosakonia quasisacchari]|uniref:NAD-dependent epimerase/dehydratase family protein n=1 Tax=Kosakonia quasisacchari TaxID=2529380 RepID=A0A4V6N3M8_9ENTR|nr:AMP-binding protein [Kosakonia quasisacchari]TCC09266.1 NAD-dependent epimerase/dehydratase family protein [Kosakonia quasisacchari]
MRVLILGGTYFLGLAIIQAIKNLPFSTDITLFNRGKRPPPENTKSIIGDRNIDGELAVLRKEFYDVIIDTSCYTERQARVASTILFENTRHYIYVSSAAVYFHCLEYPFLETDKCDCHITSSTPLGQYGFNKYEAECIFAQSDIPASIVRPTYLYGENDPGARESRFFQHLLSGDSFNIAQPNTLFQLLHVDDLAAAVCSVAQNTPPLNCEIYNVAPAKSFSFSGYAQLLAAIAGKDLKISNGEAHHPLSTHFPYTAWPCILDSSKIRNKLNWSEKEDITKHLANIFHSTLQSLGSNLKSSNIHLDNLSGTLQNEKKTALAHRQENTTVLELLPESLLDTLESCVAKYPTKRIFSINIRGETSALNYNDLLTYALNASAYLTEEYPNIKYAILAVSAPLEFIKAFWAVQYAGWVAIPTAPVTSSNEAKALTELYNRFPQSVIITDSDISNHANALSCPPSVILPTFFAHEKQSKNRSQIPADNPALILMTSGSTGEPKGVVQSHKTILARSKSIVHHLNINKDDINLNWMPLQHVGGIVMCHLQDVVAGAQQVHVATEFILSEPSRWLTLMQKFDVTLSWAPSFAFRLLADTLAATELTTLDLSKIRCLINAGESINRQAALDFLAQLSQYGLKPNSIHPCWGTSEICSGVIIRSGISQSYETEVGSFISVGKPLPGYSVKIVDDADRRLEEKQIGHLLLSGPSIMSGYYEDISSTDSTLTPDGWYRTGDLAMIVNGEVVITGRTKDIAIINGVNISLNAIESTLTVGIANVTVVASSFLDAESRAEKLLLFIGIDSNNLNQPISFDEITKSIQRQAMNYFNHYFFDIVFIENSKIPKTNIGKIQRGALLKLYQHNEIYRLNNVDATQKQVCKLTSRLDNDEESLEQLIINTLRHRTKNNKINALHTFFELGIDSVHIYQTANDLKKAGVNITAAELYSYETPRSLTKYIISRNKGALSS